MSTKPVLQNSSWLTLVFIAATILCASLYLLSVIYQSVSASHLTTLFLMAVGGVSVLGGYVISRRSNYEIFPMKRQTIGAILNGIFLTGLIYNGLQLLAIDSMLAIPIILALVSILLWLEFFTMRVAQSGTLAMWPALGAVVIALTTYSLFDVMSPELINYSMGFLLSGVAMEVSSRVFGTYLLSPWVNSFWNGWAVLLTGIILTSLSSTAEIKSTVVSVMNLPLWTGVLIACIALLVLTLRLLKQKIRIARTYMQYKLQSSVALFGFIAVFFGGDNKSLVIIFALVVIATAVTEGRVIAQG